MLNNQRGQGLIEYILIIALVGIGSITILQKMNGTVQTSFAQIIHKLQGGRGAGPKHQKLKASDYKARDMSNFMNTSGTADEE